MNLAFKSQSQSIAHSEHAQINPLIPVQFFIKGIQSLGGQILRRRVHDLTTPQHLMGTVDKLIFYFVFYFYVFNKQHNTICHMPHHAISLSTKKYMSMLLIRMGLTYIVDSNDAPFSYKLKGLLIVSVVVPFISINKHKVISPSFPSCNEFI